MEVRRWPGGAVRLHGIVSVADAGPAVVSYHIVSLYRVS
jgi:hypothetical protein